MYVAFHEPHGAGWPRPRIWWISMTGLREIMMKPSTSPMSRTLDAAVGQSIEGSEIHEFGPKHIGDLYLGQWTGDTSTVRTPLGEDLRGGRSLAGNEALDDGSWIPGRRHHALACTDRT